MKLFKGAEVLLFTLCAVTKLYVNAEETASPGSSLIEKYRELTALRGPYSETSSYVNDRVKQLLRILKTDDTSDRSYNIMATNIYDMESWWHVDMNRRQDLVVAKLADLMHKTNEVKAFQYLLLEFEQHLTQCWAFWRNEIDKALDRLQRNPKVHNEWFEIDIANETPDPELSPDTQQVYNRQMNNLTETEAIIQDIYRSTIESFRPPVPLDSRDELMFTSKQTKFDMLIARLNRNIYRELAAIRVPATERVKSAWRQEPYSGPTQQEFDNEYLVLVKFGEELVKNLKKKQSNLTEVNVGFIRKNLFPSETIP